MAYPVLSRVLTKSREADRREDNFVSVAQSQKSTKTQSCKRVCVAELPVLSLELRIGLMKEGTRSYIKANQPVSFGPKDRKREPIRNNPRLGGN